MSIRRGTTLVEVVVALFVVTTLILLVLGFLSLTARESEVNKHRAFAAEKAGQVFNELKSFIESTGQDAAVLDQFDDGVTTKPELTTITVADPTDPLSGNVRARTAGGPAGTEWKYARRVSVQTLGVGSGRDVRFVTVRVFLTSDDVTDAVVLAEVGSVIRTAAESFPPKQVFDVYAIACENVPGWWVYMSNLVPVFQNAVNDIQARNPGLELRVHWITKLGYGRDQEYAPHVNEAVDSNAAMPYAYIYPGRMPAASASTHYYVPNVMKGRMRQDGVILNGYDAATNPNPYAYADTYNNCLRYPEELALWNARNAAGLEDEPTLRLLLDDMILNPAKYKNALFINLHGELIPLPPIRNFSDAAKSPVASPYGRAVTHPEKLNHRTNEVVRFRVHAHQSDPAQSPYPNNRIPLITVVIKNLPAGIGPADVSLTRIEGGVAPMAADYQSLAGPGAAGASMYATVVAGPYVNSVQLNLYNTPTKAPYLGNNKGLDATKRPYGLEYIPAPTAGPAFPHELHFVGLRAKNTARWVIQLPQMGAEVLPLSVETRIGGDLTTGTLANDPPNLSVTHTWVTNDAEDVPFSERYQYMGDPRHCPYGDMRVSANDLGYNWYFTDATAMTAADYSGHPNLWKGWDVSTAGSGAGSNNVEVDVTRLFQWVREGLLRSNAFWTTITGYSYYYIGVGNEIGYDGANGYASSIPVDGAPFNMADSFEQAILISAPGGATWGQGIKYVRRGAWTAWPWIGELYHDLDYATQWSVDGNVGAPANYRLRKDSASFPADLRFRSGRRTQTNGCGAFYNATDGNANNRFDHEFSAGTGTIDPVLKTELETAFNYALPASLDANRPFRFANKSKSREWLNNPYLSGRNRGSFLFTYYNHPNASWPRSSSLMQIYDPANNARAGYFVVNGISQTVLTGSPFIARYCLISLMYGFLRAGDDAVAISRVPQVPRTVITFPTDQSELDDPATIDVTWTTDWLRWDGQAYASYGAPAYTLTAGEPVFHTLIYSDDGGATWKYLQDDSPAVPGQRPTTPAYEIAGGTATFTWDVSAFPEASYYLRAETYRENIQTHYSYHQQKIYINR